MIFQYKTNIIIIFFNIIYMSGSNEQGGLQKGFYLHPCRSGNLAANHKHVEKTLKTNIFPAKTSSGSAKTKAVG